MTFRKFIQKVNPRIQFYEHIVKLIAVLQRVADGEIVRLMVFMPPRHGKSEMVSRLFTAYFLYLYPERWVGLSSYGADLAYTLSRYARENYRFVAGGMREDVSAVRHWESGKGGGMWATGVGGPATGKGYHLGVIDDPLKNSEEAASENIRSRHKDWYRSTFATREEPGGAQIIILTRWNEDDLAGWLLARENDEDDLPEHWHIVSMPAIAEAEPQRWPATCTVESDERAEGEPLCSERYSLEKLQALEKRIGSYFWASLFQQRPRALEGNLFKRDWFKAIDHCPKTAWRVRYWDKAASTNKDAKFTAGVRLSITLEGMVVIEHVTRGQWSTGERRRVMRQTAEMDAAQFDNAVLIFIEQEPGSSGLDSVQDEIRLLAGFPVFADRPSGDKDTRMLPIVAQAEAGNLRLLAGIWHENYIDELCVLPNSRYRDQADATSGAYNRLVEIVNVHADGVVVHDEPVSISPY